MTAVVLDAVNAKPLPGVVVTFVGSDNGTVTDLDGRYSLNVAGGQHSIRMALDGFEPKTIQIQANGKPIELTPRSRLPATRRR